jgi:hypothetical protein
MGVRYHKRIKLFPGFYVNLSKSGPSLSIGTKGFHEDFSRRGVRTTVSLPGTGLSYTHTHKHHKAPAHPPAKYTVKARERGTDGPWFYFDADLQVQPTMPDHARSLTHAEAVEVKRRMEIMRPEGHTVEVRIVRLKQDENVGSNATDIRRQQDDAIDAAIDAIPDVPDDISDTLNEAVMSGNPIALEPPPEPVADASSAGAVIAVIVLAFVLFAIILAAAHADPLSDAMARLRAEQNQRKRSSVALNVRP